MTFLLNLINMINAKCPPLTKRGRVRVINAGSLERGLASRNVYREEIRYDWLRYNIKFLKALTGWIN